MSKEIIDPTIIDNLDIDQVTWARSYCNAANEEGLVVRSMPVESDAVCVFIGDVIDQEMLSKSKASVYMLAAVEGTAIEQQNIYNTTHTIVPSKSETVKLQRHFPDIQLCKVSIQGFPINIERIRKFAQPWKNKKLKSVCFLGETREIKNPQMEVEVIKRLKRMGFSCTHLSPTTISFKDQLQQEGCITIEGIRGTPYYQEVAATQFVINTSISESLYVSGIEAFLLGTIPILPNQDHSGFSDWSPVSVMYDYPSIDHICNLVEKLSIGNCPQANLDWYSQRQYFNRLRKLAGEII